MEIANTVIEQLCLSLIIPVVRPNSMKVFSHILRSAQSRELFLKIVPRIPKVLSAIKSNGSTSEHDLQHFIDLMSVLVNRYNICDGTLDSIVSIYFFLSFSDRGTMSLYPYLIHSFISRKKHSRITSHQRMLKRC